MRRKKIKKRKKHIRLKKKVIVIILLIIICSFIWRKHRVNIELNGDTTTTIKVGEEYKDELFTLVDNKKDIDLNDIEYKITTDLDINKLGNYKYKYTIKYLDKEYNIERKVEVIDDTPPELIINEKLLKKNICKSSKSNEAKAIDNYDGDVTDKIEKEIRKDGINYRVSDSSGNVAEVFKNVSINDKTKPSISLNGDKTVYLIINNEYQEKGFKASDNCDGDITSKVSVDGKVNNRKEGTYTLTYSVSDAKGNKTSVKRTVIVNTKKNLDIINKKKEIENYITKNKYNISVLYYDLNSNYKYSYKENTVYFGASLIKTLAALYAYEKMDLTKEIKDLVKPTIEVSNNTTYSKLVSKIGVNNLKKYGLSLGAKYVNNLSEDKIYVSTTIEDQLIFWKKLWSFVNSNKNGKELKSYFINDTARYLDFDGSPEIMHKYGLANGYFHDTGIVLDKNPYIVIILTREGDRKYGPIVTNLSKKIYELHKLVNSK